jgi:glutathione peroxidase
MTGKQKFIKLIYPIFSSIAKVFGVNAKAASSNQKANTSFYNLEVKLNNGTALPLSKYRGKKLLIVNTASDCGYTPQYDGLEGLYKQGKIEIIAFPSNDFQEQEKGTDKDIEQFCKVNFGVTFSLATKSEVKKGSNQHPVFKWLSSATENGWNDAAPSWNFCKYLIDENGNLTHFFQSGVEPLGKEIAKAING